MTVHDRRGKGEAARRDRLAALLLATACALSGVTQAHAAGTAFAVDTAEVGDPGACKTEAWASKADNSDLVGTSNASCITSLLNRVEFGVQLARTREDGEWASDITPRAKARLIPTAIGRFGYALVGGASYDLKEGDNTSVFSYVPATLRLSEVIRINVNAGWQWERPVDRHYATYGVGVDWKLTDILTFTAETFGLLGSAEVASVVRPAFQTGLRVRPVDEFSIDLIYGRNINGENANWFTIGTTVRFQP